MSFFQTVDTLIGYGYHTHVGLDSAKRIVGRRRACFCKCVKKCAFAHVGQAYDTKFHIISPMFSYFYSLLYNINAKNATQKGNKNARDKRISLAFVITY